MANRKNILAGTALGLVLAAAQAGAAPLSVETNPQDQLKPSGAPLLLAQADQPADEDERRSQEGEGEAAEDEAPPEDAEDPAAGEAPAEEQPADQPPAEEQPAEGAAEPVEEPAEAPAEEPADAAPAEEAPADEEPADELPAEEPEAPAEPPADEAPDGAAEPVAPAEEAPAEEPEAPAEAETPPADEAEQPAEEAPPAEGEVSPPSEGAEEPALPAEPEDEAPAEDEAPPEGAVEPVEPAEPADEAPPEGAVEPVEPAEPPEGAAEPVEPGEPEQPAAPGQEPSQPGQPGQPPSQPRAGEGDRAPVLDSEKDADVQPDDAEAPAEDGEAEADADADAETEAATEAEGEALPPPESDAAAQQQAVPQEIRPVRSEEGRRIDRDDRREFRRERRENARVVNEFGDRVVIELNNQIIVESNDRDRLTRDATEVYYEELSDGRTRETIVRPNGSTVVTIRDPYGDILRRSRIAPDGREYVLVYAPYEQERRVWVDPARDLPPLRLTIPVEEYILEAERVEDPAVYYDFLHQPPIEPVRRLYSIDEVKYSARIRDTVRRIDLDTITFEFGSAAISESEIGKLEAMAVAIERLLDENPAETFLIEGHTDAVGSDGANLALSDRRAESVAIALTNVFGIPPENLVTQGYGERYLKIETEERERENRRVAIRRITPLIAPVESAQQ